MAKKTERSSKTAAPTKTRKLTLKKNTIKDLTAPARGQRVQGGSGSKLSSK